MFTRIRHIISRYNANQKALRYRNFRLFLFGQGLSLTGTWIQRLAMIWLVYQLTGSALLLGITGFCEQFPIFILAPVAGVYADRWDKHKALRWLQALALIQALVLGILTLTHHIDVWHIIVLSLCLGTINAFDVPVRQSFVPDMVEHDQAAMANAIAINSTVFNLARLAGPSIAGILISMVGEGWCFIINGVSFGAVLLSLQLMRISRSLYRKAEDEMLLQKLKEGVHYVFQNLTMRSLLILLAVLSLMNNCLKILAPVFARQVLHGNAATLGLLMSASGVGAIGGALYLTNRRSYRKLLSIVSFAALGLGGGMILFSLSQTLFLSLIFMAVTGLCQMLQAASTNTLLQLSTEDDKRGRVMSFYTVASQGMQPFGSLLSGFSADHIGAPWTVGGMGVVVLTGGGIYRYFMKKHAAKSVPVHLRNKQEYKLPEKEAENER